MAHEGACALSSKAKTKSTQPWHEDVSKPVAVLKHNRHWVRGKRALVPLDCLLTSVKWWHLVRKQQARSSRQQRKAAPAQGGPPSPK